MRPKTMVLLLLALGCGLVASIGISQVMERRNQNNEPVSPKETILVAAKDIKVHELFSEKNLKPEEWPKEKIPPDAIHDLKEVEKQRAGSLILSGEVIRKAKFDSDKRTEDIPEGFRVATVQADQVSAVGNLLQAGDNVDVIAILHPNQSAGIPHGTTKTILQNVRVYSVNEQYRPSEDKSNEVIVAKTVSLLVPLNEAELLEYASKLGDIRLVLRSPNDKNKVETTGSDFNKLMAGETQRDRPVEPPQEKSTGGGLLGFLNMQKAAPAPQVAVADPDQHYTVELMQGNEQKTVEFSRKGDRGRWISNTPAATGAAGTPAVASPASVAIPGGPSMNDPLAIPQPVTVPDPGTTPPDLTPTSNPTAN